MRRNNYPTEQDPQKNPDRDEDEGGRGSHDRPDPDPDLEDQPMRVGRRAGIEDDDAEEIDLAEEDLDEVSELDEEQDAKKGDGPDA
jgi:hypothetical protein